MSPGAPGQRPSATKARGGDCTCRRRRQGCPPAVCALSPLDWAWGASKSCQQHGAAGEETAAVARLSSSTPAPVHRGESCECHHAREEPHTCMRAAGSRAWDRAATSGRHAPPQRSSELYPAAMGLVAVVHLVEAAVTQQAGQCQLMVSARLPEPGVGQRARLVRRRPASRKRGCHTSKARQYDSWLSRQQKSILGHRSFLA